MEVSGDMKTIEFPEQTGVLGENQPQYDPMPVWRMKDDVAGRCICCWKLNWRERLRLLFTGKIWHHILTFNDPLQPQLLQITYPFKK